MATTKTGNVNLRDYEYESYVNRFNRIADKINKDLPDMNPKVDKKGLALTVGHLLQFMEDALGKDAPAGQKPFPKLPAKLFRDFSANGPLQCILSKCYEYKQIYDWKRLEFSMARREEVLDMLRAVRGELMQRGFLKTPKVFLTPGLKGDARRKAKDIVYRHGGEVHDMASGATHHLYPNDPNEDPDDTEVYLRTLERRPGEALVHWWYFPDSYDEWVSDAVVQGVDTEEEHKGAWKVYMRWVTDTNLYNEWMNEVDYDCSDEGAGEGGDGGSKRKGDDITPAAKRSRADDDEGAAPMDDGDGRGTPAKQDNPEVIPGAGETVAMAPVEVVKQQVGQPHPSVEAVAKADTGEAAAAPTDAAPIPGAPAPSPQPTVENLSQGQKTVEDAKAEAAAKAGEDKAKPAHARELYRVPSHAAWFTWGSIHELERRGVPEFFNGTSSAKTPRTYREYRDAIINKYREDVRRRLTFTECRRSLAGDVNAIHRVYSFLDHWGLINFVADGTVGAALPPPVPVASGSAGTQAVRMVSGPGPPSASSLFAFKAPTPESTVSAVGTGGGTASLVMRRPSLAPGGKGAAGGAPGAPVEFACDQCSQRCTRARYHCQKKADYDLCPDCFADGKFDAGLSSADFLRMDAAADAEGAAAAGEGGEDGAWTDHETLLLLEALEMYGENWHEVAEHVGTKTQPQCILHFIQLPIEDPFLDELSVPIKPGLAPKQAKPAEAGGEGAAAAATAGEGAAAAGASGDGAEAMEEGGDGDAGAKDKEEGREGGATAAAEKPAAAGGEGVPEGPSTPPPGSGIEEPLIPFADASNPVMAQVAFLASMVGPRVAAAAAQAALSVLSEEEPANAPEAADAAAAVAEAAKPPAGTDAPAAPAGGAEEEKPAEDKPAGEEEGGAGAAAKPAGGEEEGAAAAKEEEAAPVADAEMAEADDPAAPASEAAPDAPTPADPAGEGDDGKEDGDAAAAAEEAAAAATPDTDPPPSGLRMRTAATTAIAAAAVKAKLLADQEEREIQRLVVGVIEDQLKKLEVKLRHFEELEEVLEREREQIEQQRQQLYADRVQFQAARLAVREPPGAPPS